MVKKITLLTFLVLVSVFTLDFINRSGMSNVTGAPAGHTGSPGDGANCTSCHTGPVQTGNATITSPTLANGYIPGNTYAIQAGVTLSTATKFGFQISSQNTAGNLMGTLVVTDAVKTKLTGGGKYITHTNNGTTPVIPGAAGWSFNWTAPSSTSPVTFYGSFNAANGNNTTTGDSIYLFTFTVNPDPSVGIAKANENSTFRIYPTLANDRLFVEIPAGSRNRKVTVISLQSQILFREILDEGVNMLDLTGFASGTYFVISPANHQSQVLRFIKN